MIKLKGLFYKPGINGCGVELFSYHTPYHKLFNECCCCHDACYDLGGNGKDRFKYDRKFLQLMIPKCQSTWHVIIAMLYYLLVRLFGWLFFNYKDENSSN